MGAQWIASAGILAALTWQQAALAANVTVVVEQCPLRQPELQRLVTLELSSVLRAERASSEYQVSVRCVEGEVLIRLHDPLTQKQVERWVLAPPPNQPEPERAVALSVAQLYRASWLELVAEDPAPLEPSTPAPPPNEAEAARELVEPRLARRDTRRISLALGGGLAARNLQRPIALPHVELQLRWWPLSSVWLSTAGGFEASSTERATGTVDISLLRGGLSVGAEVLRYEPWSAFAELGAAVALVQLEGNTVPVGYEPDTISSAGIDSRLAVGIAWTTRRLRLEVLASGGYLTGTPQGLVDDGQAVSLNGASTGGALRLLWLP